MAVDVATRPMEALLTDALDAVGLAPKSVTCWHEEASFYARTGRRLRADQWHFEVRLTSDRSRVYGGCFADGWLSLEETARWMAERVKQMTLTPGAYGHAESGETKGEDGQWRMTGPGLSFGVGPELTSAQKRQTGRRTP